MKNIKFSKADDLKISLVKRTSEHILSLIGINGALTTDESYLSDFLPFGGCYKIYKETGDLAYASYIFYKNEDALSQFGKNIFSLSKAEMKKIEKKQDLIFKKGEPYKIEHFVDIIKKELDIDIFNIRKEPLFKISSYVSKNLTQEQRLNILK